MSDELDTRMVDDRPMHVLEFEGDYVREMEGRFPAQTVEMPAGYVRGMHLLFHVEARVRNVHYDENRKGDLVRVHRFAIEHVHLAETFDPNDRPNNVGGSSSGDAWRDRLVDYIEGRTNVLDFGEAEIPERLYQMLERGVQPIQMPEQPKELEAVDEGAGF